jgi:hypothetical protein
MRNFSISADPAQSSDEQTGTLLWIGEREAVNFRDAYQYCEASVSQLAFRSTLQDASVRPASDVRRIIVARVDRTPISTEEIEPVARRHDGASWMAIEGPLCGGATRRLLNQPLREFCYLHQWRQSLPSWISHRQKPSSTSQPGVSTGLSLAIIASNYEVASSLMDLADSCGCVSAWFRSPHPSRMRNFDNVWWDDSVATEATMGQWQQNSRLAQSSAFRRESKHVWLTNSTCSSVIQHALAAGVACVMTKPFRIDALLETLSGVQAQTHANFGVGMHLQRTAA